MKKIKINNLMIDYIPKYSAGTQKLLHFLLGKIKKEDIIEKIKKNEDGIMIEVLKSEVREIFTYTERKRRAFYNAKEKLHDIIKIRLNDSYIESSFISYTDEKQKGKIISFYIPKYIIHCLADPLENYYLIDFSLFCKFKKKSTLAIYQLLRKNKFKGKIKITPREFNELLNINLLPGHIKEYLKNARIDLVDNGSDIDFSISINRENRKKINYFEINIFKTNETMEENTKKLENEVLQNYNKLLLINDDKQKQLIIANCINNYNEYQSKFFYKLLRNGRKEIDRNIIAKIENSTKGNKNKYYYDIVCNSVLIVKYSDISKTIDNCNIELSKGKINNNIAFVLSRLKNKIDEKIL